MDTCKPNWGKMPILLQWKARLLNNNNSFTKNMQCITWCAIASQNPGQDMSGKNLIFKNEK